jgi:hypothetical protein
MTCSGPSFGNRDSHRGHECIPFVKCHSTIMGNAAGRVRGDLAGRVRFALPSFLIYGWVFFGVRYSWVSHACSRSLAEHRGGLVRDLSALIGF